MGKPTETLRFTSLHAGALLLTLALSLALALALAGAPPALAQEDGGSGEGEDSRLAERVGGVPLV